MPVFIDPDKFRKHAQYVILLKKALKTVKADPPRSFLYFKVYPFDKDKPLLLVDSSQECQKAVIASGLKPTAKGKVKLTANAELDFMPKEGKLNRFKLQRYFDTMGGGINPVYIPAGEVDEDEVGGAAAEKTAKKVFAGSLSTDDAKLAEEAKQVFAESLSTSDARLDEKEAARLNKHIATLQKMPFPPEAQAKKDPVLVRARQLVAKGKYQVAKKLLTALAALAKLAQAAGSQQPLGQELTKEAAQVFAQSASTDERKLKFEANFKAVEKNLKSLFDSRIGGELKIIRNLINNHLDKNDLAEAQVLLKELRTKADSILLEALKKLGPAIKTTLAAQPALREEVQRLVEQFHAQLKSGDLAKARESLFEIAAITKSAANRVNATAQPTGEFSKDQEAPRGSLKRPTLQRTKEVSNPDLQKAKASIQRQDEAKAESQNFAASQPGAGALQGEKYAMKSMGAEYIARERDAAPHQIADVKIGGKPRKTRQSGGGTHATLYMTPKETKASEVTVVGSDAGTKLTQKGKAMTGEKIFVMDGEGKIMAQGKEALATNKGKKKVVAMDSMGRPIAPHHSNFLRGEAVAGAGELHTKDQGNLKKVTNQSGHYRPDTVQTQQVLSSLEEQGANLDNVMVKVFTHKTGSEPIISEGMAKEFQQGGTVEQFNKRHDVVKEMKSGTDSEGAPSDSKGQKMFRDAQNKANKSPENSK